MHFKHFNNNLKFIFSDCKIFKVKKTLVDNINEGKF